MKAILWAALLALALSINGCTLNDGETRKITAWGVWAVAFGSPIGIGYWHSERGPSGDVKSEESAKPPVAPSGPSVRSF